MKFGLLAGSPQAAESVWKVQLSEPNLSSQMTALQLQAAYEVSCSTQQGAGAAQLIQTACNSIITSDGRIKLQGYAACAAPVIRYTPILAKSISPQPLSKYLQSILRGTFSNPFQACRQLQDKTGILLAKRILRNRIIIRMLCIACKLTFLDICRMVSFQWIKEELLYH